MTRQRRNHRAGGLSPTGDGGVRAHRAPTMVVALLVLALVAPAVLTACVPPPEVPDDAVEQTASAAPSSKPTTAEESPSAEPEPTREPVDAAPAQPEAPSAAVGVFVSRVVDGDTVEMADGSTIRLIGIDTPERGECGYQAAAGRLSQLVLGVPVVLEPGKTEDSDRYGRLLRYVNAGGTDAGRVLLAEGLAVPRYNSTDGYGWHTREDLYFQVAAAPVCSRQAAPATPPFQAPPPPADSGGGGAEPWNQPGPDLDCADIGQRVRITGPDYHRLDADGDGWGCESYG